MDMTTTYCPPSTGGMFVSHTALLILGIGAVIVGAAVIGLVWAVTRDVRDRDDAEDVETARRYGSAWAARIRGAGTWAADRAAAYRSHGRHHLRPGTDLIELDLTGPATDPEVDAVRAIRSLADNETTEGWTTAGQVTA